MSTTLIIVIIGSSLVLILMLSNMLKRRSTNTHFNTGSIEPKVDSVPTSSKDSLSSEKKGKVKRRPFIVLLSLGLAVAMPIFFLTKGCSSDYLNVTFVIEENGKKYLFSKSEFLVKNAIKKNEVPPTLNSNLIYIIDEDIYMRPSDIEDVVNILSENYKFIEKQEPSYNGYAVKDSVEVFTSRVQNKAGKKIGETEVIQIATLSKLSPSKQTMEIKWKTVPSLEAISNCSIEDIWAVTNPQPGTTVGNWEEDVLVNTETINKFFNNTFELIYDEESAVVYFKKVR